jgi:hypothetical protein
VRKIGAVRKIALAAATFSLLACRGETPPRDYQNNPPAMTHPPQTKAQTPSQNGMPAAAPEPNSGVEGTAAPQDPKLKDQAPVTGTTATTTTVTTTAATTTSKP